MNITPDLQSLIDTDLTHSPRLSSDFVVQVLKSGQLDIDQLMVSLLPIASQYARTPISNFKVGTVALGDSGALYLGSNMEFSGEALSFSVHGEQSAINHAWIKGEAGLKAIAVNAAPCGYCRQFMNELSNSAHDFQILLRTGDDHTSDPLTNYLPNAFGPSDLNISDRLMRPDTKVLKIADKDPLAQAALIAANESYAPYSGNFSGVAIMSEDQILTGRYAENAAYNPSMSPLQSALANLNMSRPPQAPYNITRAVLVEAEAPISQKAATETVLSSVAPGIELEYLQAT